MERYNWANFVRYELLFNPVLVINVKFYRLLLKVNF